MAVSDYNVEPGLNVSISGINIAEGCAPSGINDAIRQLMADVKAESEARKAALGTQAAKDGEQDAAIGAVQASAEGALASAGAAQAAADAAKAAADAAQVAADAAQSAAGASAFPSGTKMLFHQASAPTGWTKQASVDNAALRVVSGTSGGGTGGSIAFSTLFAAGKAVGLSGNVGATTLTVAQMPSHSHTFPIYRGEEGSYTGVSGNYDLRSALSVAMTTSSTGSSSSHTHSLSGSAQIDLNVKYTDVIICAKD